MTIAVMRNSRKILNSCILCLERLRHTGSTDHPTDHRASKGQISNSTLGGLTAESSQAHATPLPVSAKCLKNIYFYSQEKLSFNAL